MKVKFNLSKEFKKVPEGEQVLTISDMVAKPKDLPKELTITYTDKDGNTLLEKCNFTSTVWKLSRLCEKVLNIKDGDEMELDEIVNNLKGKKIKCEVVHTQGTQAREDGTYPTFANINKILGVVNEEETTTQATNPRETILKGL